MVVEVNFDGIVGPTHSFAGLASGNLASAASEGRVSNPRAAAHQGLDKMARLMALGVPQAVLPPHPRPDVETLRRLGFGGDDAAVVAAAAADAPELFAAATSASAMWVANAATVTPAVDTADGRIHLTPANLATQLHRSIEATLTTRVLRTVFADVDRFVVHDPLPVHADLGDEGAANHSRLGEPGASGLHLFVFGRSLADGYQAGPQRHPARQTDAASRAVARRHGLARDAALFVRQLPEAIDAGVFHNDVIGVGHRRRLLIHEHALVDQTTVLARLAETVEGLVVALVPAALVPLEDAVSSYLFNSQLVTAADGRFVLIAPTECQTVGRVVEQLGRLIDDGFVDDVEIVDLTESMGNGGGPACLRLRVEMDEAAIATLPPGTLLDVAGLDRLGQWVDAHYRDELRPGDLRDPGLLAESQRALDELTSLLGLGPIYPFQR